MNLVYRRATENDAATIHSLLESQKLPTETVGTTMTEFYLAIENKAIVGVAGFEYYGEDALSAQWQYQPHCKRNESVRNWLIG